MSGDKNMFVRCQIRR